jgi:hypothetical protein
LNKVTEQDTAAIPSSYMSPSRGGFMRVDD